MSVFADSVIGRLLCRLCRTRQGATEADIAPASSTVNPEAPTPEPTSPEQDVVQHALAEAQEEARAEPYEIVFFIDPETLLRTDPPAEPVK
jgi:hypothetical protein